MDATDLSSLVDDLGHTIDDLEQALNPLLDTSLSTSASKLPLLDKAKLYVLATYTIESLIFSALRLNGVDAKSHPVFQELSRVKAYFEKIKAAETVGTKRSTILDKDAAGRFIKHGLSGNDAYDRTGRMARERAGAKRKLDDVRSVGKHTRFDELAKRARVEEERITVVRAEDLDDTDEQEGPETISEQPKLEKRAAKRHRRKEARLAMQSPIDRSTASGGHLPDGEGEAIDDERGKDHQIATTASSRS